MKKLLSLLVIGVMIVTISGLISAVVNGDYDRPCADVDICTWTTNTSYPDYGLPLGSEDTAQCGLDYNTYWPLDTTTTATCVFDGDDLENAMLYISINNDVVSCTLNGQEVFGSTIHEGCAPVDPRDGFSQDIYSEVSDGTNTLICEVEDRGVMTHFDACVIGDYAPCELIIDEPSEGDWFDSEAINIEWHLEGACTDVFQYHIQYLKDDPTCDPLNPNWDWIVQDLSPLQVGDPPHYLWDKPQESGQYCVRVKVTSESKTGYSEIFNVDLAPPVVSLDVGTPQVGDCDEEDTGDCYINQDTEIEIDCLDNNPDEPWQSGVDYIKYRYSLNGDPFTSWMTYSSPFSFPEDSNHVLEYRCFDNVGKVDTESKDFIVDSQAPEITKEVIGPQYGNCPPEENQISFLYDDLFEGVDDSSGWSTTSSTVDLDTPTASILSGNGLVTGYQNGGEGDLTHRGTRGLGVYPGELDEVDEPERIEIEFDDAYYLNYIELRSLFADESKCGDEGAYIEYYLDGDLVASENPIGVQSGGNGVWSKSYDTAIIADKIIFYAEDDGCSEFAVARIGLEDCHIDGVTEIHVTATDPDPHPVDDVQCEWRYRVIELDGFTCWNNVFPIQFPEECTHELQIRCWDALGNGWDDQYWDYETFYVDSSAPYTEKWYEGPQHSEQGYPKWINGVTTVHLDAGDNPEESICAVGVETTYWRNTLVDDVYCMSEASGCSVAQGSGEWNIYEGPFPKEEESCHLIEYYSVDLLGNTETVNKQCVFVDLTPPEPIKEVGEPSHDCHGFWELITGKCEENWDWIITMNTSITISCEDQEPHPSGVKEICYRIELDGDAVFQQGNGYQCSGDITEYQEETWCCVPVGDNEEVPIWFYEPSEHLLEFYCVDNVNKTSEPDSELFKVEGEAFTIELLKKWNLISIPFNLISNNIEEVFDQISEDVEVVWTYYGGEWYVYSPKGPSDLETIEPGYGYWVKANEDTSLVVGGSLLAPGPGVPPSRQLQEGWNLIGHYGTDEKEVYCSLFSLVDTTIGHPRWSALYSYDASSDQFNTLDVWDNTYPGEGYWIEMDVEDTYSPATACWGFW